MPPISDLPRYSVVVSTCGCAGLLADVGWVDAAGRSWDPVRRRDATAEGLLLWACESASPQARAVDPGTDFHWFDACSSRCCQNGKQRSQDKAGQQR